jgi:hypothetical protein
MNWTVEYIPNSDFLYRRVHANILIIAQNWDDITPFAFKDNNGISVDWNKHSTPEESRQRAVNPEQIGIIQIKVESARQFQNLSVDHTPLPSNRAHANINGLKTYKKEDQTDIRKRLARLATWIIKCRGAI